MRAWLLLIACLPALSGAQELPPVSESPPAIPFDNWRFQGEDRGAAIYEASFPTPLPSGYPENDTVRLRVATPITGGPFPVVLVLHYWGASDLRLERAMSEELVSRGIAAAILTLPYHLERTPAGRVSGEMAIEPDPVRLRRTMTQSVLDARRAIDFLQTRRELDPKRIGLSGTSLGAVIAGVIAGVDSRVQPAAFVLGGADIAGILWSSSRLVTQRETLRRNGESEESLRAQLASVEPLRYLPQRRGLPSFVISGRFDTVVPPAATRALIEALGDPTTLSLDTGHYGGVFVQRRVVREVARFFEATFAERSYEAPAKLVAPTVRLGASLDIRYGLDLSVGLDVWTFDRQGLLFATVAITPRGLQAMISRTIAPSLAVSLSGSTRGLGLGLYWSVVL